MCLRSFAKWMLTALVAVGAGGLVWWKQADLRDLILRCRAAALLSSAEHSLEERRFAMAKNQALVAFRIRPSRIEPLRVAVAAAQGGGEAGAARLALALQAHDQATAEDKALALRVCRQSGEDSLVPALYSRLSPVDRMQPGIAVEMSRYWVDRGDAGAAYELLKPLQSLAGQNPELGAGLAHALIHSPDEQRRGWVGPLMGTLVSSFPAHPAVRAILEEVAYLPDHWLAGLGFPEDPSVLLLPHGEEPGEAAILAVESLRAAKGSSLDLVRLDEFSQRCGASPALCRWLNVRGRSERVLALVSEEAARTGDLAYYQERLQALFQLGLLEDAESLLQVRHPFLDAIRHSCLLAKLYQHQGRAGQAAQAWEKALQFASGDEWTNRFLEIARLAREAGASDVALRAMHHATRHPKGRLPCSGDLLWLIESLGQSRNHEELLLSRAVCSDRNRIIRSSSTTPSTCSPSNGGRRRRNPET